ncbi:MAG: guanylate kinase [Oscillospiraceae bacterium]|nr:guanylate kinase [Oscillospiraceae bacterium]
MKRGRLFIVSGPSGVGKSTVLQALLERRENARFSISATTRPIREGEIDGVHYYFVSVETFKAWIEEDDFLEYAEYVGNFYGTPKKFVEAALDAGQDILLDIEIQGAMQVKERMPDAVKIFIGPPSWKELERRLTSRGTNTKEDIEKRLVRAKVEAQAAHTYDYFVINDTVENAVRELDAIITAEHCKPKARMKLLADT